MPSIYQHLEKNIAKNRYLSYTHPPYELEQELILSIKHMHLEKAITMLNQINSLERAYLSNMPLISLKYSLVASCTIFTRAIIDAGVDSETAFILSDYYINQIDKSKSNQAILALEYKMLEDFISLIGTQKIDHYSPIINQIIGYIKTHIEQKTTIHDLATLVNKHPNYLSYHFKKEVGVTILSFIDYEKIAAIKNHLIHTNSSMNEVSDLFQFSSPSYFSSYFKKHTQLTPVEYCKLHKVNNH